MANGRGGRRRQAASDRDAGGFVALPWVVLDSPAYAALSNPAKALLFEFARQIVGDNNGCLRASATYLRPRGWNSVDVITRAKRELLKAGFIHETVKGQRPNKASWYAVTWRRLDHNQGYDPGAAETFQRSSYAPAPIAPLKPSRDELYAKWHAAPRKNTVLRPLAGAGGAAIAPAGGVDAFVVAPLDGPMRSETGAPAAPPGGDHLEMPSTGALVPRTAGRWRSVK